MDPRIVCWHNWNRGEAKKLKQKSIQGKGAEQILRRAVIRSQRAYLCCAERGREEPAQQRTNKGDRDLFFREPRDPSHFLNCQPLNRLSPQSVKSFMEVERR